MEVESVSVFLGGGQSGVYWAEQHVSHMIVMDKSTNLHSDTVRITVADALSIPLPDNSVRFMRADFLLNVVFLSGLEHTDIIEKPDLLMSPEIPPIIRQWYEKLQKPFDIYIGDLLQLTWLVRQVALEEMLRVLMPGGSIIILDHRHVTKWVLREVAAYNDIIVFRAQITDEDHSRSQSLQKLKGRNPMPPIVKIYVTKR